MSQAAVGEMLTEQEIDAAADALLNSVAFTTEVNTMLAMLDSAGETGFDQLVESLVQDAGRSAESVATTVRPNIWHVRYLSPPSCGRCAVLAGRVYRYSDGFRRHPRCDCLMTPTTEAIAPGLITSPDGLFRNGQIGGHRTMPDGSKRFQPGLSAHETEAVRMGADLNQVVNVKRKGAGLTVGSSVMYRAGRLTPNGCLTVATDRADALRLLRRYGYIL